MRTGRHKNDNILGSYIMGERKLCTDCLHVLARGLTTGPGPLVASSLGQLPMICDVSRMYTFRNPPALRSASIMRNTIQAFACDPSRHLRVNNFCFYAKILNLLKDGFCHFGIDQTRMRILLRRAVDDNEPSGRHERWFVRPHSSECEHSHHVPCLPVLVTLILFRELSTHCVIFDK
jgi:hypothetical protein